MLDGPGFHVDVDVVDGAARGVRDSVRDQNNFELRGLCGDSGLYGHAGLHDALMDYCVKWSAGLDVLTGDASEIGDTLSRAVQAYRSIDEAASRTLGGDPGTGAFEGG
ncbi:hypothetical protein [Amycolatopsis panacis]|uniref:ESX-1 secretion-associated protein n=1 Tax=Amycolatopsis panacis TaxID=2340917 RepID=A0A419HWJ6_9PSEU|nr:hypothetical protein [Amycolatopsis panacis]RJQ81432.1 hypothetical protein D5S19_23685 [Amycolatopsis panacis]